MSPELKERAQELVDRYPVARSALLPLLHLVQSEEGHVSSEGIALCADVLGLTKAEVAAVATFYTMYKREPMGEHLVSVCTNFSCAVRGAKDVYARLSSKLGVGHNGTTADGKFTLEHAECLGNCEGAPVVTVDYLNYECVTPEQAEELVDRIAAGEIPPPTRGPIPPGVRNVEFRLSAIGRWPDGVDRGVVAAAAPSGEVPATDPEREAAAGGEQTAEPVDASGQAGLSEAEVEAQGGYDPRTFTSEDQGTGSEPAADGGSGGPRPVGEHDDNG